MRGDFLPEFMGGNQARARLLRVFVFDPERSYLLKDAAKRAGISPQVAAREIGVLEKWGVVKKGKLVSVVLGNGTARKVNAKTKVETWSLDPDFKHRRALSAFVHEISPMRYENVVEALRPCGKLATVILSGTFVGDATRPVDILVAADELSERRLENAIKTLEPIFGRELRYAAFSAPELRYRLTIQDRLVRDTLDFPHVVLLDRGKIL
ncbi:MAG TPA: hypothetical protein VMH91_00390 [Candidatus Paceibacterota bacterium]|nr:hypothetical protein [Candidatus Paceibacterota bacterium]